MSIVPINRLPPQPKPSCLGVLREVPRVEIVSDDPEVVLRHHLDATRHLAHRLRALEEDLTIFVESGMAAQPKAIINALRELERTRGSVAHDLRATAEALNRVILDRYRAGFDDRRLSR